MLKQCKREWWNNFRISQFIFDLQFQYNAFLKLIRVVRGKIWVRLNQDEEWCGGNPCLKQHSLNVFWTLFHYQKIKFSYEKLCSVACSFVGENKTVGKAATLPCTRGSGSRSSSRFDGYHVTNLISFHQATNASEPTSVSITAKIRTTTLYRNYISPSGKSKKYKYLCDSTFASFFLRRSCRVKLNFRDGGIISTGKNHFKSSNFALKIYFFTLCKFMDDVLA